MEQFEKVFKVRKWKHSSKHLAERVEMPEDEFKKLRKQILKKEFEILKQNREALKETIKQQLFGDDPLVSVDFRIMNLAEPERNQEPAPVVATDTTEDLEAGTMKYEAISTVKPRTPREIIELLQVDEKEWKLRQYWVKEKKGSFYISALVQRIQGEEKILKDVLEPLKNIRIKALKLKPVIKRLTDSKKQKQVLGILSLQDLHFGKEGNEDISETIMKAMADLARYTEMYSMEEIKVVLGSDTLNMDTFLGTTTSGTPVSNSMSAVDAYMKAFHTLGEVIQFLRLYCQKLTVVFIPGNHDRLSSFHLVHALEQAFAYHHDVEFDSSYQERKVFRYGSNFIGFEHGDKTAKLNPMVFAVEHPAIWGETKFRYLYTGHTHGRKTRELITENEVHGFVTKTIPALTGSDYWHKHNKFVGNTRATQLQIHDKDSGIIAEFTFNLTNNLP